MGNITVTGTNQIKTGYLGANYFVATGNYYGGGISAGSVNDSFGLGTVSTPLITLRAINSVFNGNVGIGTTSPVANLAVQSKYGDGSTLLVLASSTSADGSTAINRFTFTNDTANGLYDDRFSARSWAMYYNGIKQMELGDHQLAFKSSNGTAMADTISAPTVGALALLTSATNNVMSLQFGGTTSAFPAIKNVGQGFAFRLADDSADATTTMAALIVSSSTLSSTFAGNVGIGTTNPTQALEVFGELKLSGSNFNPGSGNGPVLYKNNTNGLTLFGGQGSSNDMYFANYTGAAVAYIPTNTTNFVFAGNVGIGTTSPSASLQVEKDAIGTTPTDGLLLKNITAATTGPVNQYSPSIHLQGQSWASISSTSVPVDLIAYINSTGNSAFGNANFTLAKQVNNGGYSTVLTVDQSGNLVSTGSITSSNGQYIGTVYGGSGSVNTVNVYSGTSNRGGEIDFAGGAATNPGTLVFRTGTTGTAPETMRLNANGYLGIGTTTPGSKLSIHDSSGLAGTNPLFTIASSTAAGAATTTLFQVLGNGQTTIGGNLLPSADNTYSLGGVGARWSNLYAGTTTVGDLVFGNNFRILEAASSSATQAMIWRNQNGQNIFNLDQNGNLALSGDICTSNVNCFNQIANTAAAVSAQVSSLANTTASQQLEIQNLQSGTSLSNSFATMNSNFQILSSNIANLSSTTAGLSNSTADLALRVSNLETASSSISQLVSSSTVMNVLASSMADILVGGLPSNMASSSATSTGAQVGPAPTSFIGRIASAVVAVLQSSGQVISSAATWTVNEIHAGLAVFTDVKTSSIETQTASVTNGLEMTDQATGQIYCVQIENGDFTKTLGSCSNAQVAPAQATSTTPQIPNINIQAPNNNQIQNLSSTTIGNPNNQTGTSTNATSTSSNDQGSIINNQGNAIGTTSSSMTGDQSSISNYQYSSTSAVTQTSLTTSSSSAPASSDTSVTPLSDSNPTSSIPASTPAQAISNDTASVTTSVSPSTSETLPATAGGDGTSQ